MLEPSQSLVRLTLFVVAMALAHRELTAEDQGGESRELHEKVLRVLAVTLPREHISRRPLNDAIAIRWFDLFIGKLDPRRCYFTAEDIRQFSKHRRSLDDHARRGDLKFADLVRHTHERRLREATNFAIETLDVGHDFAADEQFNLHPYEYCEDETSLRQRWRKRVKYELMIERSGGLLLNDAVTKLRARYQRTARVSRLDDDALYELYLDAMARSFGPHNTYYGERTLASFRCW